MEGGKGDEAGIQNKVVLGVKAQGEDGGLGVGKVNLGEQEQTTPCISKA